MESERFDRFAKAISRLTSRRALLRNLSMGSVGSAIGLSGLTLLQGDDESAAKSKKQRRRQRRDKKQKKKEMKKEKNQECNDKGKTCATPLNPCQKAVCQDSTCVTETLADGASCGAGQVCSGGQCVAACGSGATCGGGTTCCSNACVDTRTSVANCGSCGAACSNTADTCASGTCQCGSGPTCTGGQGCDSGTCICPNGATCTTKVSPSDLNDWFGYNDLNDTVNNALLSFVAGPDTPPDGVGSVEMTVSGEERHNIATYQFAATPLDEISELRFTTYNPENANYPDGCGYLQFNVDFDLSDTWQRRLVFVPANNGNVKQEKWQEWDAIRTGAALWNYSGATWPIDAVPGTTEKSWDDILTQYPDVRIRVTDAFLGVRIGEPYQDGFAGNVGSVTFGTNSTTTYDFEPDS